MSLPKSLKYNDVKAIGSMGTPHILRFQSQNQTYSGDIIRIEIPTGGGRNLHLFPKSSYVECDITLNVTTSAVGAAGAPVKCYANIDQSIYSLIRRMRVIHSSNTIEDWLYFSGCVNALYDVQVSQRQSDSLSLLTNYLDDLSGAEFVYQNVTGSAQTVDLKLSASFPLPSAILGVLNEKSVPLSQCGASSIYLELELNSNVNQIFYIPQGTGIVSNITSLNSYTVSNIFYNAKVVELPSDIEMALMKSVGIGNRILIPSITYKAELLSLSGGITSANQKISVNNSSVKALFFYLQSNAIWNNSSYRSITSRQSFGVTEYAITINGIQYPIQLISGKNRFIQELKRAAFGTLNDSNNNVGILNSNVCYNYDNTTTGVVENGAVASESTDSTYFRSIYGLDLDRFEHNDLIITGTNTNSTNVNLLMNFQAAIAPANMIVFWMLDIIYKIENGLISIDM